MLSYEFTCNKCEKVFFIDCPCAVYEKKDKEIFKCPFCKSKKIIRTFENQDMIVIYGPGMSTVKRKIDMFFGNDNDPNTGKSEVVKKQSKAKKIDVKIQDKDEWHSEDKDY